MELLKLVARARERGRERRVISLFRERPVEHSHTELMALVDAAAGLLRSWGVRAGMRVGLRAPNSLEWVVHDLALIELRAVCVAFTDDFAHADPAELADKYQLSLLLVAGPEGSGSSFVARIDGANGDVRAIDRTPDAGDADFERPWRIFSSGSSGGLKGLAIHRRGVEDWIEGFAERLVPREDDRLIVFLPMSNFQQRPMVYAALWYGIDIVLTNPARLFIALRDLAPTIMVAPPALYEVFETRVAALPAAKRMAGRVLGKIAAAMPAPLGRRMARAVFRQAWEALGGRMRFMITGMAPIKRSTLDLFALMQLPLFETYGLIECGSVALSAPGAAKAGSVGRPLRGLDVTLAEDGEIMIRRSHPTADAYFECAPGESERTFRGGNVVASGDHGRFDEDGFLYLIGRKKEIIITGGGEKVHPEAIEAAIDTCPDVAKSVVFGKDGASSLSAVIVLREPSDAAARARVDRHIERWNAGRRIEVGKVVFADAPFSRENGFLRPNLKLDRKRIGEHFLTGAE
jgi:long-chain acyl-CoA synthetase